MVHKNIQRMLQLSSRVSLYCQFLRIWIRKPFDGTLSLEQKLFYRKEKDTADGARLYSGWGTLINRDAATASRTALDLVS